MTSKNLFFNLLKEEMKRKTWAFAMAMLAFFFAFPVTISIMISEHSGYINETQAKLDMFIHELNYIFKANYAGLVIVMVIGAIICGLGAFNYLHSKRKVDMYHSLPIKRQELFAVNYICGMFVFLIPYLVNIAVAAAIVFSAGYGLATAGAMSTIGITLLCFLLIYTTAIIAVMLTGNIVVSFIGMLIFFIYVPLAIFLKQGFQSVFFKTVSTFSSKTGIFNNTSPIFKYQSVLSKVQSGIPLDSKMYIGIIIAIVLLIALAIILHARRGSETAGRAMTFNWAKITIKYALVIMASMASALLFYGINIYGSLKIAWYIFGLIAGLIISHSIIEIIYEFDFRAIWKNKRELLFLGVIVAAMSSFFILDLGKYDSYIPKIENVDEMSISINDLDGYVDYLNPKLDDLNSSISFNYMGRNEYRIREVIFKDKTVQEAILNIAKKGIENALLDETYGDTYIYVRYKLKNGEEAHRAYNIDIQENLESIKTLFESPEYKKQIYPVMQEENRNVTDMIAIDNGEEIQGDMVKLFLEAYVKDLEGLTIDNLKSEMPIASFNQYRNNKNINVYSTREGIGNHISIAAKSPIYPSFTNTIRILDANNISLKPLYMADMTENTFMVRVTKNNSDSDYIQKYDVAVEDNYVIAPEQINTHTNTVIDYDSINMSKVYIDKAQVEEILNNIVINEYFTFNTFYEADSDYTIYVEIEGKVGQYSLNCVFDKDSVPEFIINDFK